MELICELGSLFIGVILIIAIISGLITFIWVILEFLYLGFECIWMLFNLVFFCLPKWCWKKVRDVRLIWKY